MALTVFTWKNRDKGKGIRRPVESLFMGGNVGHAAVELTWPADEAGDVLAKKYQDVKGITISMRTELVPEKQTEGTYKPKERVVYFAYFSWWPGKTNGHHINKFREDRVAEWSDDPDDSLGSEQVKKLYGEEGAPKSSKTTVKGYFTPKREVTKVKQFEHLGLKSQLDIEKNPAYILLNQRKQELMKESERIDAKGKAHLNEVEQAQKENRKPDTSLNITEEEYASLPKLITELAIVENQITICKEDFEERYKSVGRMPDVVVSLPTNTDGPDYQEALDSDKILEFMVQLSESKKAWSLHKLNCSAAVKQVIQAGIGDELKERMKEDGFDVEKVAKVLVNTPTSVAKFSQKMQTELLSIHNSPKETEKSHKTL